MKFFRIFLLFALFAFVMTQDYEGDDEAGAGENGNGFNDGGAEEAEFEAPQQLAAANQDAAAFNFAASNQQKLVHMLHRRK